MIQPILINFDSNSYSQKFHYYPFAVKLGICVGSCKILNDLPNKVCIPNKIEDLNLSLFNMITGINESKTLTKHISCECKARFDERKCNSDQWWNNDKSKCKCKVDHVCEKDYVCNPSACSFENGKYLVSIMDDLVITLITLETQKLSRTTKKQKLLQQILMKKYSLQNTKFIYFTCLLVHYHCIIVGC